MRRLVVLAAVLIGLVMPAAAQADWCERGTCIPGPTIGQPWERYQRAAIDYWTSVRSLGYASSPSYTVFGNAGAQGYAIPHWCRQVPRWWGYGYGVIQENDGSPYPELRVGYIGMPTPFAYYRNPDACRLIRGLAWNNNGNRGNCLVYLHEWGHLLGWAHQDAGNRAPIIMGNPREVNDYSSPAAKACIRAGL